MTYQPNHHNTSQQIPTSLQFSYPYQSILKPQSSKQPTYLTLPPRYEATYMRFLHPLIKRHQQSNTLQRRDNYSRARDISAKRQSIYFAAFPALRAFPLQRRKKHDTILTYIIIFHFRRENGGNTPTSTSTSNSNSYSNCIFIRRSTNTPHHHHRYHQKKDTGSFATTTDTDDSDRERGVSTPIDSARNNLSNE